MREYSRTFRAHAWTRQGRGSPNLQVEHGTVQTPAHFLTRRDDRRGAAPVTAQSKTRSAAPAWSLVYRSPDARYARSRYVGCFFGASSPGRLVHPEQSGREPTTLSTDPSTHPFERPSPRRLELSLGSSNRHSGPPSNIRDSAIRHSA